MLQETKEAVDGQQSEAYASTEVLHSERPTASPAGHNFYCSHGNAAFAIIIESFTACVYVCVCVQCSNITA